MRGLTLQDIRPLREYEAIREPFRSYIIDLKRRRRVPLGDRVTLLFENRETVLWQVQEMMRAERITDPEAIQFEIDVYGKSIPGGNELSATMFIELTERDTLRQDLDQLVGLNHSLRLRIGDEVVAGESEPGFSREDRIAAVQYVRFRLTPEQAARFKEGRVPVAVEVDHPNYRASTALDDVVRQELSRDLD